MRPFRPRFALVLSVVLLGVAAYYVASANAAPPKGTLTKCTGQTESSVPAESIDCTDEEFLCPAEEGEEGLEECNGSQIRYRIDITVDLIKKDCTTGIAQANWEIVDQPCTKSNECILVRAENGDPSCEPNGPDSFSYVGKCTDGGSGCNL